MLRMPSRFHGYLSVFAIAALSLGLHVCCAEQAKPKPGPDEALSLLKTGNARFVAGKTEHPNTDVARLRLAGSANQGDYAYATVLTCSDSRVPVERIFDAGVMDLFVIRVAGNVCNTDEIGSIEYGLAHVHTPVLVVLGHSQCGAVTAVTQHLQGKGHALERNIPPLIKSIQPAVKRAMYEHADLSGPELIACGIEENVWTAIENLFRESPAVRELVAKDKVRVLGAIYDVGTGSIAWLPENRVHRLLGRVEADPQRALDAMAQEEHPDTHKEPATMPARSIRSAPVKSPAPQAHPPGKGAADHGPGGGANIEHSVPAPEPHHGDTKVPAQEPSN